MNESFKVIGTFKLNVFKHINGKKHLIERYIDKNKVVDVGREQICHLLGNDGTNKHISTFGVGINSVSPSVVDTALTDSYTNSIVATTYPTTTSVQFDFALGTSEGNGKEIREYGLICADGTLFARKTRTVLEKDVDVSFEGTWTISIV